MSKNNYAVKKFIELQIKAGERYEYVKIQNRFNDFFKKEENHIFDGYKELLTTTNELYRKLNQGEVLEVSDWIRYRLKNFIEDFNFHKNNPDKPLHPNIHVELKDITGTKIIEPSDNQSKPSSYFRKGFGKGKWGSGPWIKMRGHYSVQKVPIDEFGCVVVCDGVE